MRIFHISEIARAVTDIDVQIILGVSQLNNRRRDLTGMLAPSLEARASVVEVLKAKIAGDPHHRTRRC